jgi:chromosomal replication initiation ATPase DnaA
MICVQHRIKKRAFLGRSRDRRLSDARMEAYYHLRMDLCLSLPQIGRLVGGRDRTTVTSGLARYIKETGRPIQ